MNNNKSPDISFNLILKIFLEIVYNWPAHKTSYVQAPQTDMQKLDKIRNLDEEVFDLFQGYSDKVRKSTFTKKFPQTCLLTKMMEMSGNLIKNSIFDCCEVRDFYGVNILQRSLIENYIRHKYIYVKWSITQSDDFAKEYYNLNQAKEVIEILKANVSGIQLENEKFKIDNWNDFLKEHPEFRNRSKNEIEKETRKFSFKNIIKFLNRELKDQNGISEFLGKLIVQYSALSSYTHGGIMSYNEIVHKSKEEQKEEFLNIASLAFKLSGAMKIFSLSMYMHVDKDCFQVEYKEMNSLLQKVMEI